MQHGGRHADTRTVHAEHHTKEFLGGLKLIAIGTVMRHQQPAGEPRLQLMMPVSGCYAVAMSNACDTHATGHRAGLGSRKLDRAGNHV